MYYGHDSGCGRKLYLQSPVQSDGYWSPSGHTERDDYGRKLHSILDRHWYGPGLNQSALGRSWHGRPGHADRGWPDRNHSGYRVWRRRYRQRRYRRERYYSY